jgi:beta-N-acetylhexosaminidase
MDMMEQLAARLVIAGIRGPVATPDELDLVRRGIGGVILFSRNVQDPAQVATLAKQLKSAAPGPLMISIDQEGGRVQRLRPPHWTALPTMRRLGELDDVAIAARLATLMAQELNACGIDQDFAPVVDVNTNAANPVIGNRAFGSDPQLVAKLGVALATALEKAGIASCAKHYPGHGDTSQDSHHTLPRLSHDLSRLRSCELVPFFAAARAGVASLMTAHVVFEELDDLPATLSPRVMRILREEIGYAGCVISDDLEMAAIAKGVGVREGAVLSVMAGCDAVLVCHSLKLQHESIDAIANAARSGPMPIARLHEAAARVAVLQKFAKAASAIDPGKAAAACGTHESRAFVESLAAQAKDASLNAAIDPTEKRA